MACAGHGGRMSTQRDAADKRLAGVPSAAALHAVLETTAALEDVGVVGVVVAFAHHLNAAHLVVPARTHMTRAAHARTHKGERETLATALSLLSGRARIVS